MRIRAYLFKVLQSIVGLMKEVVGPEGFEPSTNGLKGRCSTAELRAPHSLKGLKIEF